MLQTRINACFGCLSSFKVWNLTWWFFSRSLEGAGHFRTSGSCDRWCVRRVSDTVTHHNELMAHDKSAPLIAHLTSLFLEGSRLCQILQKNRQERGTKRSLHGSQLHHGTIELLSAKIERLFVVPGPNMRKCKYARGLGIKKKTGRKKKKRFYDCSSIECAFLDRS